MSLQLEYSHFKPFWLKKVKTYGINGKGDLNQETCM